MCLEIFYSVEEEGYIACVVISRRRYWYSMVPGKYMEDHFGEVKVGETDAIQGKFDGVIYNLWGTKESNYVMRIIDTDGHTNPSP